MFWLTGGLWVALVLLDQTQDQGQGQGQGLGSGSEETDPALRRFYLNHEIIIHNNMSSGEKVRLLSSSQISSRVYLWLSYCFNI